MRMGADGYALDAEGTLVQPLLLLKCVGPPPPWFRADMVKLDTHFPAVGSFGFHQWRIPLIRSRRSKSVSSACS